MEINGLSTLKTAGKMLKQAQTALKQMNIAILSCSIGLNGGDAPRKAQLQCQEAEPAAPDPQRGVIPLCVVNLS